MHLTRFTDLSLRVLIYLTHNERKGLVTVTELAERFKWSRNHMVKVVHFMSTKNWVQTHRGRFGGLTLKMHPSEYKIGDIVQILEEQGELIDCFEPHECALAKCCKLRSLLNEATRDFYSRLNTATLETLTNSDEIREIISGKDCSVPSPTPRRRRAASSSALWRRASPANSARPDSNASAALIAPKKPRQAPACGAFPFRRFRFFLTPTPGRTSPKRRRRPRASLRTRA